MRWDPLLRMYRVYEGGSPPENTTSTTVNQLYSPEEAARRAQLMAEAQNIYSQTSVPQGTPGAMSGETQQSQMMMAELAKQNPWASMAGELQGAQTFGFNAATDPTSAPGFQNTLNTALRGVESAYTSPTGPFAGIRSGFTGASSGGSGTREGVAMGMAGQDYLNTVGDVTGRLTSDAYTKGLDVFSRTMALAPQNMQGVGAGLGMPASIMGGIGAQKEGYDEREKLWEMQSPWMALQPYANAVMGMSNPSTQTTNTAPAAQKSPMAGVGMAMMGASLFPANPFIGAGAGLLLSLFD